MSQRSPAPENLAAAAPEMLKMLLAVLAIQDEANDYLQLQRLLEIIPRIQDVVTRAEGGRS